MEHEGSQHPVEGLCPKSHIQIQSTQSNPISIVSILILYSHHTRSSKMYIPFSLSNYNFICIPRLFLAWCCNYSTVGYYYLDSFFTKSANFETARYKIISVLVFESIDLCVTFRNIVLLRWEVTWWISNASLNVPQNKYCVRPTRDARGEFRRTREEPNGVT